jgi:hypothetical protein
MKKINKLILGLATTLALSISVYGACAYDIDGGGKIFSNFKAGVVEVTGDLTLDNTHNGRIIDVTDASNVTITLPANIPTGYNVMIVKSGDGNISIAQNGNTLISSKYPTSVDHNISIPKGSITILGLSGEDTAMAFGNID